jgi:hypothetical protein
MGASGPSGGGGGGGGGSPNQRAKDKAKKEKAKKDAAAAKAREAARVNQYSTNKTKSKNTTTTRKSTDDKRNTARENAAVSNYTSLTKDDAAKIKKSRETVRKATGKSKLDNYEIPKSDAFGVIGIGLNATRDLRQKSFETNRKFFQEKVLTSKNRGNYEDTFDSYSKYMNNRLSGSIDAYGNINPGFDKDKEGNIATKKVVGGQTILTETKTPEKMAEEKEKKEDEYDIRKVKKRGRRRNILTSSKGVTTVSPDYSLGKPSLLGSV